jgi:hypothetical protein
VRNIRSIPTPYIKALTGQYKGSPSTRSAYAARSRPARLRAGHASPVRLCAPAEKVARKRLNSYTGSCFSYPAAPVSLHDTSTRSLRVAEYAIVINCSDGTAALLSNRSRRPSGIVM